MSMTREQLTELLEKVEAGEFPDGSYQILDLGYDDVELHIGDNEPLVPGKRAFVDGDTKEICRLVLKGALESQAEETVKALIGVLEGIRLALEIPNEMAAGAVRARVHTVLTETLRDWRSD